MQAEKRKAGRSMFRRKLAALIGVSLLTVAGCVSTLAQEPTPEIDAAECSWLASEGKVFRSNLQSGDQLRSTVSLDGIANTAERMTGDASPEAVRELQALQTASIDLKNWLNDLEGDAEQEVRAFTEAFNNVIRICNRK